MSYEYKPHTWVPKEIISADKMNELEKAAKQVGKLKPVSETGSYNDLNDKPQIAGHKLSGNMTAAALGFSAVATSGAYTDLSGTENIATKDYVSEQIDAVEIGGRNLLPDTNVGQIKAKYASHDRYFSSENNSNITNTFVKLSDPPSYGIEWCVESTNSKQEAGNRMLAWYLGEYVALVDGQSYTLSCWARSLSGNPYLRFQYGASKYPYYRCEVTSVWKHYSWTFSYDSEAAGNPGGGARIYVGFQCDQTTEANSVLQYCGVKLEVGNKSTGWSPAPEDFGIGGRNLIVQSKTEYGYVTADGGYNSNSAYSTSGYISVLPGESLILQGWENISDNGTGTHKDDGWLGAAWFDSGKNWINPNPVKDYYSDYFARKLIVPTTAAYIRVSYDARDVRVKLERGNNPTDWSPAPEDVEHDIGRRASVTYDYNGVDLKAYFGTVENFYAALSAGDFRHICVGDYWPITLNGTIRDYGTASGDLDYTERTLKNVQIKMEIAGIGLYYHNGAAESPHVVCVSRDCLPFYVNMCRAAGTWESEDTNPYMRSALYKTYNDPDYGLVKLVKATDIGAHILNNGPSKYIEIKNIGETTVTSWAAKNVGTLFLPTVTEIFGAAYWADKDYEGGSPIQYPIFAGSNRHITKCLGDGGNRVGYWCASSYAGRENGFCVVGTTGSATAYSSPAPGTISAPIAFVVV